MREIILLRTHFFDNIIEMQADRLAQETDRRVVLVVDESKGVVEVPERFEKISLTQKFGEDKKLFCPPNFGWLCGDYVFYAAMEAMPDFDYYWMVEGDVRIKFDSLGHFFNSYSTYRKDMLSTKFFPANSNWYWHKPMAYFTDKVYGCVFPVMRLSRQAVASLLRERRRMTQIFQETVPISETHRWPNDESFVASTLMDRGFRCADFNSFGRIVSTSNTFKIGLAMSHNNVESLPVDGMLYHPVHAGEKYFHKICTRLKIDTNSRRDAADLRNIYSDGLISTVTNECGAEAAVKFRAKVEAALLQLSG